MVYREGTLAQPTHRPVRNRRSGHPTERWLLKVNEQIIFVIDTILILLSL